MRHLTALALLLVACVDDVALTGGAGDPCQRDSDCKGARVCSLGACAEPPPCAAEFCGAAVDIAEAGAVDLATGPDLVAPLDIAPHAWMEGDTCLARGERCLRGGDCCMRICTGDPQRPLCQ